MEWKYLVWLFPKNPNVEHGLENHTGRKLMKTEGNVE